MSFQEWSLLVGVALSVVLALVPWMFKVHAKLAVIAGKITGLCDQVQRAAESHQKLWVLYAEHEARLDTHDVGIAHIEQRLKDI